MGNRRIGNQLLHVLLHQRNKTDVNNGDQRQRDDEPGEIGTAVRNDRQRQAHEAVATHLQHDGRKDDRSTRRCLDMRIRQPRVHGPHRYLDRKREQERDENQLLRRHAQTVAFMNFEQIETTRLTVQVDECDQHQHRTKERVQEEL